MFGNPEVTTGGRALKFYSSVRLDVRQGEMLKQGGVVVGRRTKVKVAKNKVAPPFKQAEFDITFGEGISREADILDLAVEMKVVIKSGAWYSYNGEKVGQGRENAKKYLREHTDIRDEIEKKVREEYGLGVEKAKDGQEKGEKSKSSKKKGANAKKEDDAKKEEERQEPEAEQIVLEENGQAVFEMGEPDFLDTGNLPSDEEGADAIDLEEAAESEQPVDFADSVDPEELA